MIRLVARHTLEMSPRTYWEKCFLDAAYTRELFLAELRYVRFDVDDRRGLRAREAGQEEQWERRVVAEPGAHDVPFAHVIGRALAYQETGVLSYVSYARSAGAYVFRLKNLAIPDALELHGSIVVESTVHQRTDFLATVEGEVRLFGMGDAIERRLEHELRRSFRLAVELANVWVAKDGGARLATFRAGRPSR